MSGPSVVTPTVICFASALAISSSPPKTTPERSTARVSRASPRIVTEPRSSCTATVRMAAGTFTSSLRS